MNKVIEVIEGDITTVQVDAIVNAANEQLAGGGGVDGAIHRAGGPTIMAECREIGSCPTGQAVMTNGGKLPADKVIHTVGPVWSGGNQKEAELLASCYRNSLILAEEYQLKRIAFPNISTGVYGYPKKEAARIAVQTVEDTLRNLDYVEEVVFVCFDEENESIYKESLGHN
ncbi:O-acetyl-ADP-ribose deacetylase [Pontibacillus yanchengensis]|uniref:O-acetyl-ADP-ribose deacetylase n=2 Tax=Pontibacillus yanchengensis TaxID=462910 RepID=A0ACC7VIX7_9BACI|nr:O-acetyl-ADP-ribose deacetylase [Pontibacillus yanchengensis]MYL34887.1 O-acetyl-ADP-ribose deacetylase [Pontibacillus yanchengensis]MYL54738.1 O-acetyl-ADP-ribose deacetylase [Pontibacillus yanchengensis]